MILTWWQADGAIERRDVVDDVDAADGAFQAGTVEQIAREDFRDRAAEGVRTARVAHERSNVVAPCRQIAREMSTGKSCGACDKNPHRSATIVTGEPRRCLAPSVANRPSVFVVKRSEPMALCKAIGSTNCR